MKERGSVREAKHCEYRKKNAAFIDILNQWEKEKLLREVKKSEGRMLFMRSGMWKRV